MTNKLYGALVPLGLLPFCYIFAPCGPIQGSIRVAHAAARARCDLVHLAVTAARAAGRLDPRRTCSCVTDTTSGSSQPPWSGSPDRLAFESQAQGATSYDHRAEHQAEHPHHYGDTATSMHVAPTHATPFGQCPFYCVGTASLTRSLDVLVPPRLFTVPAAKLNTQACSPTRTTLCPFLAL